ncbi:MAG TPA: ABC transporter substrate-binding protein [Beijerinckiaceae bacterium]|nr:ABC transporter substrate-binding protein [Rhodoblastus sp.]MCB9998587.1 ABC transporter substrate-binding protein [Methylobacteriaceae bacterium]HPG03302.1 ABC transporter substrate-binding protein [Rhodoblastus sp.]HRY04115.1 ABC transporter substrate-binding protein [Beijerinckiaceae bacterium]
MRPAACVAFVAALAAASPVVQAQDVRPKRIVSINQCTDELVLRLADADRVASVSWLSRDAANSNVAALADRVPVNHGLAEEVMSHRPDVVLAGAWSSRTTVEILKRLGVKLVEFDVPRTFDEARAEIRKLAAAIGEQERGEAMVRDIDAGLAALPSPKPPLRALVMQPNGFTVEKGSLVEEIMNRAGLENLASRVGGGGYLQVPLEAVALQQADVMILNGEAYGAPSLATAALEHPIIKALGRRLRVVALPPKLWTCVGPNLVEATRLLIAQTRGAGTAAR